MAEEKEEKIKLKPPEPKESLCSALYAKKAPKKKIKKLNLINRS